MFLILNFVTDPPNESLHWLLLLFYWKHVLKRVAVSVPAPPHRLEPLNLYSAGFLVSPMWRLSSPIFLRHDSSSASLVCVRCLKMLIHQYSGRFQTEWVVNIYWTHIKCQTVDQLNPDKNYDVGGLSQLSEEEMRLREGSWPRSHSQQISRTNWPEPWDASLQCLYPSHCTRCFPKKQMTQKKS